MQLHSLIALGTIALASCDPTAKETGPETPTKEGDRTSSVWPATSSTDAGAFSVTLAPSQGDILWNKHFTLDLSIAPKNPDAGPLTVLVDADMPAHRHGMNTRPEVVEIGKLRYQVEGMLFHMKGDWVITVEVREGDITEQATFPVFIKE